MRIRKLIQTTIAPETDADIRKRAKESNVPLGVLLDDAWLFFKGTPTPMTLARREMIFPAKVKRAA